METTNLLVTIRSKDIQSTVDYRCNAFRVVGNCLVLENIDISEHEDSKIVAVIQISELLHGIVE